VRTAELRVGLVAGVGLALLVACTSGQQAQSHTTSLHDQAAPVWHRFVQCARQNGLPDLADPTIDDQGQAEFPDGTPKPPPISVQQACRAILDQLPVRVRGGTSGPTPDVSQLRQFAQCMRQQGITDWPDPDSNGNFPLPPSLSGDIKRSPRAAQILAAWHGPCKRYDPTGGISVAPQ
jgi:hypothetical protein